MIASQAPLPERDIPEARRRVIRSLVVENARSTFGPTRPGRQRGWVAPLLAATLVLLMAAGAGAAYILTRPATELSAIGCYERPLLKSSVSVVRASAEHPTSTCARLWRHGDITGVPRDPPPLVACVLPSGTVGVFPGPPSGCGPLGLVGLGDGFEVLSKEFASFNEAVLQRLDMAGRCYSREQAAAVIRQELDRSGLDDWTVKTGRSGFSPDRPCSTLWMNGASKTAELNGQPPLGQVPANEPGGKPAIPDTGVPEPGTGNRSRG
jgi:hypothetical protein